MKLFLIRHGQTDWNTAGKVQGRTDVPLNEMGRKQAAAVAQRLAHTQLDAIYTGPLSRAWETAEAIARFHDCPVVRTEALTEIRFGLWEGKTAKELHAEFADLWDDWNWILHPEDCERMGAESAQEILARALHCVEEIKRSHPLESSIAIVSHTMPIKLITAHFIGLPLERIRAMQLGNCGCTQLRLSADGRAGLYTWNDMSHVERLDEEVVL